MSDKYKALDALAAQAELKPDRAAESAQIRALSVSHPGALREAELVSPAKLKARRLACEVGQSQVAQPRANWREQGMGAVVLWAALHQRISTLLDARRKHRAAGMGRLTYEQFFAGLDPGARADWVAPRAFALADGHRLGVRVAYLAVAYQAGLSMAELYGCLFERTGSWTSSVHDPAWARP